MAGFENVKVMLSTPLAIATPCGSSVATGEIATALSSPSKIWYAVESFESVTEVNVSVPVIALKSFFAHAARVAHVTTAANINFVLFIFLLLKNGMVDRWRLALWAVVRPTENAIGRTT